MNSPRKLLLVVAALVAISACASGGGPRPPIDPPTPPQPPICNGRDVVIYTFDPAGKPIEGVVISSPAQDTDRISDGGGFSHRWACDSATYTIALAGWHTTNCGDPGAACDLAGPEHNIHLARDAIDEPDPPTPGVHPHPVVGAIWAADCFGDDTGCRTFTIIHAGDTNPRWQAPCAPGCWPQVLADLDDWAAADYHIVRMWSHLRPEPPGTPWAHGGDPPYNGLDAVNDPDFVEHSVALINAIAERGMRATLEAGGLDGLNREQEGRLADRFREVGDRAGWWKIAWVAPVNEPSSTHATTDDDGDADPGYLRQLVDRIRGGSSVLWHLGHASNTEWDTSSRFAQKKFTPRDQKFGYYHGYRGQEFDDQARHRFSWMCPDCEDGNTGGAWVKLWVDGESIGQPLHGPPLRYVSVAQNGHQLDAEALSLIAGVQSLRGIHSFMSGTGVQRYQPFTAAVGFREVPWTVAQLPSDIHTFRTFVHGGRGNAVLKAVTQGNALLRVEQSIGDDGRFVAVAYSDREGQSWSIPATRAMRVKVCDTGHRVCGPDQEIPVGGSVSLGSIRWGRLILGRVH